SRSPVDRFAYSPAPRKGFALTSPAGFRWRAASSRVCRTNAREDRMADTITYLTTTRFGSGAIELLPQELAELGIRQPLLVTDQGIARLPLLDRVRRMLPAEHAV